MSVVLRRDIRDRSGAALLASLAMLLIFTVLGTVYVRYMMTSYEGIRYELQDVRANHLSRGGIYAGIGELQAALKEDRPPVMQYDDIELPVYRTVDNERETFKQDVSVMVWDEAARVNLNFAPKKVLVALGIPARVVDELRRKGSNGSRVLLSNVDDLRTRDYMNGQSFNVLDKNLFTVYTGAADGTGTGVNLNAASPVVLSAIFGIDADEAASLAAKRPFSSWDDVRAKVAREPSTFNVFDGVSADRGMPSALLLGTRAFRLRSVAIMKTVDTTSNGLHSEVEAVVNFSADGSFSVRFWNETPSEEVYDDLEEAVSLVEEVVEDTGDEDAGEIGEDVEVKTDSE